MKDFFKFMFASMVGCILLSIICLVIFIVFLAGIIALSGKKEVHIRPNSVLWIKLDKPIPDRTSKDPLESFNWATFEPEKQLGLDNILKCIKKAKTDNNIKGIYLDIPIMQAGIAAIEEIRNVLIDFKESGKFIVSYSELYTHRGYYLASVADSIFLHPEGDMIFIGLKAELMFFKGTLDKLGIEPQVIRHGSFKSAAESFTEERMSPENRLQIREYLSSVWGNMLKDISKARNIGIDELTKIADSVRIQDPKDALSYKMVDKLAYKDEALDILRNLSGIGEKEKVRFIKLEKYVNVPKPDRQADIQKKIKRRRPSDVDVEPILTSAEKIIEKERAQKLTRNKIAVIFASGGIESGEGDEQTIGSERISEAIRQARLNKNVKAIVLRVNSPGGSAIASDVIWREVVLASQVKPVIASMGDVAASGGYYISCAADTIVASPATLTGSIGVFGLFLNTQKFLNEKLGVTVDTVKTNALSDLGAFYRPIKPIEKEIIQRKVDNIYNDFITKVAEGRDLPVEVIDSLGGGRIYSGEEALKKRLIDTLGGLEVAINIAARAANVTDYKILSLPRLEEPFEKLLKELTDDYSTKILIKKLEVDYRYYKMFKDILHINGLQARWPYEIEMY